MEGGHESSHHGSPESGHGGGGGGGGGHGGGILYVILNYLRENPLIVALVVGILLCFVAALLYHNRNRIRNWFGHQQQQIPLEIPLEIDPIILPTMVFDLAQHDTNDCMFCLEQFENGDLLSIMPSCGHFAHEYCLQQLYIIRRKGNSCPYCRATITLAPLV